MSILEQPSEWRRALTINTCMLLEFDKYLSKKKKRSIIVHHPCIGTYLYNTVRTGTMYGYFTQIHLALRATKLPGT